MPRIKREAVRWYRAAAEQGNARAQYNLGAAYDNGKGIAQDRREAARWYRAAAEQGNTEAQINLGKLYLMGEGVTVNNREAYIWFSIAKASGNSLANLLLVEFNRHDLLSQTEINSAQEEAKRRMEAIKNRP